MKRLTREMAILIRGCLERFEEGCLRIRMTRMLSKLPIDVVNAKTLYGLERQLYHFRMNDSLLIILRCILDLKRSRNQRQGSDFFLGKWT